VRFSVPESDGPAVEREVRREVRRRGLLGHRPERRTCAGTVADPLRGRHVISRRTAEPPVEQSSESMIDPEAKFTDEEARQILVRAASREERAERVSTGRGLNVHALQEIAREVGLDPLQVEAAAREALLRRESPPVPTWLGIPLEAGLQRVVPGTVSDAGWERMVAEFRRAFRTSGITSQFGGVREWISASEKSDMPVQVRLEPVDESTLVTLQQPMSLVPQMVYAVGGTFSAAAVLFAVLAAIGSLPLHLSFLFFAMALLGSLGVWGGYRAWLPRREEQLRAVADRVELIAREM
jgi:hypothetical protein